MVFTNLKENQEKSISSLIKDYANLPKVDKARLFETDISTAATLVFLSKKLQNCHISPTRIYENCLESIGIGKVYTSYPFFEDVVQVINSKNLNTDFDWDLEMIYLFFRKYLFLNFTIELQKLNVFSAISTDYYLKEVNAFQKAVRKKDTDILESKKYGAFVRKIESTLSKDSIQDHDLKKFSKKLKHVLNFAEIDTYRQLYFVISADNKIDSKSKKEYQLHFFDLLKSMVSTSYQNSYMSWLNKEDDKLRPISTKNQINRFKINFVRDFTQDKK